MPYSRIRIKMLVAARKVKLPPFRAGATGHFSRENLTPGVVRRKSWRSPRLARRMVQKTGKTTSCTEQKTLFGKQSVSLLFSSWVVALLMTCIKSLPLSDLSLACLRPVLYPGQICLYSGLRISNLLCSHTLWRLVAMLYRHHCYMYTGLRIPIYSV
jgi:hypothetical protein